MSPNHTSLAQLLPPLSRSLDALLVGMKLLVGEIATALKADTALDERGLERTPLTAGR
mgnify:CR=1 FL=1